MNSSEQRIRHEEDDRGTAPAGAPYSTHKPLVGTGHDAPGNHSAVSTVNTVL